MPGHDGAYASFVLTHEARLVRSLVSETGLSRTAAASVAAVVLPAAFARGFATHGAAYGWLRVAARHVAADGAEWAEAADAALVRADLAAAALAELPATDRELLRLRYVEGLLPDTLAERLGVGVADVQAGLDRARVAAMSSLPAPRRAVSVPRAAAAFAAAAAAVALSMGGHSPTLAPPSVQAGTVPVPFHLLEPVTGSEPVPALSGADVPVRGIVVTEASDVVTPLVPPVDDDDPGNRPGGGKNLDDTLVVSVPTGVRELVGEEEKEIPFDQPAGRDRVSLCDSIDSVPSPPTGVRCVRGHH